MKIYLASSWRNQFQPLLLSKLRKLGHEVYDFRNPKPGDNGFSWREIDTEWSNWSPLQYRDALSHPVSERGFRYDFDALMRCDACVVLLPCGRSAHLEAGFAIGQNKPTLMFLTERQEPELMYKMADDIAIEWDEVVTWLKRVDGP